VLTFLLLLLLMLLILLTTDAIVLARERILSIDGCSQQTDHGSLRSLLALVGLSCCLMPMLREQMHTDSREEAPTRLAVRHPGCVKAAGWMVHRNHKAETRLMLSFVALTLQTLLAIGFYYTQQVAVAAAAAAAAALMDCYRYGMRARALVLLSRSSVWLVVTSP
jgi:uncharacterized membrane protein